MYAEEENVNNNTSNDSDNNANSNVPVAIRRQFSYHESPQRKATSAQPADVLASTVIRPINADVTGGPNDREARIMVTLSKPNRTSDTTDFARNTVPVKDQTATDPTVKKTEPPWKNLRKPNHDFIKNKVVLPKFNFFFFVACIS